MDSLHVRPRAIIFDIGDVLLRWSVHTTTTIPAQTVKKITSTPIWHSYERGEISQQACYELCAQQFSYQAAEIAEVFAQARRSLQSNHAMVSFIRNLKSDDSVKVYAMSNVGKEDFEELATIIDWQLFDEVFTSGAAGMRKPELAFYRRVLDQIGLLGNQVVFIDDKIENIQAATTLGIRGLLFNPSTVSILNEMFDSPVARGWRFMFRNAQNCETVTSSGLTFTDNFSKLLVLDTLQDPTLTDITWGSRETWNFFAGEDEPALAPGGFLPDDLDTTCLALKALRPSSTETVSTVLDTIRRYRNDDGSFQAYYDRQKSRVDAIVNANILACFYTYDCGHEFEQTLQLVQSMLQDRSYLQGTRYYPSPDCCLGFVARLLGSSEDAHLQKTLGPLLSLRVEERLGLGGTALDLAMRIITCTQMGIPCESDRRTLLDLQCEDGGWEGGWLYQFGTTGTKMGNRAVTTAMAIAALSS